MTAAIQCYELAIALNEISEETSYVDIQRAASLLSQCTSNILHVTIFLFSKISKSWFFSSSGYQ